jgi:hypothetical protein
VEFHAKFDDLKMFGFARLDQGFYSITIAGEGECQKATCIIQVLNGSANEEKMEEELKNFINKQSNWQVKQVDSKEYTIVFPDKGSLDTFSKISEIMLSIHGLKVKILKSNMDLDAVEVLQTTWVRIYGLHAKACKESLMMKVATFTGEPLLVDELSLIKVGAVRVKMNCRDPLRLRGIVRIFFNKIGHDIKFVSEKYKDKESGPPSPPYNPREDYEDDGDDEMEDSGDDKDRRHLRRDGKHLKHKELPAM